MIYVTLYNGDVTNLAGCVTVVFGVWPVFRGSCTQTVVLTQIWGRFSPVTDCNGQKILFCALQIMCPVPGGVPGVI